MPQYLSISTRAMVLTLKATTDQKTSQIAELAGITSRHVNRIYSKAIERGFDPTKRPLTMEDHYVEDAKKSGRPSKRTPELEAAMSASIKRDDRTRELSAQTLALELKQQGYSVSATTVLRTLRKAGFRKTKPTRKPGLTQRMRDDRLKWCLDHRDWTIEDWKNVIWSDETSVVLNHRRGGYRVWRQSNERFVRSCIRRRWKGASEFMFWGCFTYDQKGPCHCWKPETAQERRESAGQIEELNRELEPSMRTQWEISTGVRRINLNQQPPGRRPQWNWTEKTGKLVRKGKGGKGIDWWRYQSVILVPKMIPFAQRCKEERPQTIVQEDKAPAHTHWAQAKVYDMHQVARLLWCGNSPDLNPIEPTWMYMKRWTTKNAAPRTRADATRLWEQCWQQMPQEMIQAWIERIPRHVQKIIELKGGNEYQESRDYRGRGENAIEATLAIPAREANTREDDEWQEVEEVVEDTSEGEEE